MPHPVSLIAWNRAFGGDAALAVPLAQWMGNSLLVTISVTTGRLVIDSMAGYALARLRFAGRGVVFRGVLAVMAVPGVVSRSPSSWCSSSWGCTTATAG